MQIRNRRQPGESVFFVSAALSVVYGKTLVRNRKGWLYREDEPTHFRVVVGIYDINTSRRSVLQMPKIMSPY